MTANPIAHSAKHRVSAFIETHSLGVKMHNASCKIRADAGFVMDPGTSPAVVRLRLT